MPETIHTLAGNMSYNMGAALVKIWETNQKLNKEDGLAEAIELLQAELDKTLDTAVKEKINLAQKDELPLFAHIKDIEAREKAETPAVEIPHSFEFLSQEERRHFLELNNNLEEMK